MDQHMLKEFMQLGSTVVTVLIFIWYLEKRDRAIQDTLTSLRDVIHELKGRMFKEENGGPR